MKRFLPIRILQLTDLHLSSQNNNQYDNHFTAAIRFIQQRKVELKIDGIVVTGDISHEGQVSSYRLFFDEMDKLDLPYSIMPGNHDNCETLPACSSGRNKLRNIDSFSNSTWSLYSLDTVVRGEDYGSISDSEILRLTSSFAAVKDQKVALFMHHHPLSVGTPLVDSCKLLNPKALLKLCRDYPVHFLGTGHAHTLSQQKIGHTLISVAPAVSSQWVNGTSEVKSIMSSGFNIISLTDRVYTETHFI